MTIETKTATEFGKEVTLYRAVDDSGFGTLWHSTEEKAIMHLERHRRLGHVRRAAAAATVAAQERNEAIQRAHAAGEPIRAIAAEAGLSSARVHQVLHGK